MYDKPENIAHRVRLFRQRSKELSTQREFAAALGIDQQRLSGYENNVRIPHEVLTALIRLGANPYWLFFGEGQMMAEPQQQETTQPHIPTPVIKINTTTDSFKFTESDFENFYVLPLYADEAAAATPLEIRDTVIEGPAIIHRAWCPNPDKTVYVRVSSTGDSMAPAIPAGSMVTIDRSFTEPAKLIGKIVAIAAREGDVTLRRLIKTKRGIYVGQPDNPTNRNRPIALIEGDCIIGLVRTVHALLE